MLLQSQQILKSNGIVSSKYIATFFSSAEDTKLAQNGVLEKEDIKS